MSLVPEEMLKTIVDFYHPREIYLFGSRARGDARADSDYDLCLLVPAGFSRPPIRERANLRRKLGISTDIVFYPADRFERFQKVVGSLAWTVQNEGKRVYVSG